MNYLIIYIVLSGIIFYFLESAEGGMSYPSFRDRIFIYMLSPVIVAVCVICVISFFLAVVMKIILKKLKHPKFQG